MNMIKIPCYDIITDELICIREVIEPMKAGSTYFEHKCIWYHVITCPKSGESYKAGVKVVDKDKIPGMNIEPEQ